MIGVDVRHNLDRVEAELKMLGDVVKDKATVRALNRALDQTATQTSREIRKVYNIRHKAVMAALKKLRANKNRLWSTLRIQGARIPLIEFDARWRPGQKIGATVKVKVAGGRKPVRGGFIAAGTRNNYRGGGSAGMLQVFRRVGPDRYPIRSLRSISLPQAFANQVVLAAVKKVASESFLKNLRQQIKYLGRA